MATDARRAGQITRSGAHTRSTDAPHRRRGGVRNMEMRWVSACPSTGALAAYPRDCQELLEAAFASRPPRASEVSVPLGARCFGATVHIRPDGRHRQHTPACGSKPTGRRSVARVAIGAHGCLDVFRDAQGWHSLHFNGGTARRSPVPDVPTEVSWEWCMQTQLARAVERDWVPYDATSQVSLEQQFGQGAGTVALTVGLHQIVVDIDPAEAFMRQADASSRTRLRWVRRKQCTEAARAQRRNVLQEAADLCDDACALCTEPFRETAEWPVRRSACAHTFHGACINQLIARDGHNSRCPLCRAALTFA